MLAFAGTAVADPLTVPANSSSQLATFGTADANCYNTGKPRSTVVVAPEHGSVAFEWVSATYGKEAKACHDRPTKVISIVYRPDAGYHGPDYLKVSFAYDVLAGSNETALPEADFTIVVQ